MSFPGQKPSEWYDRSITPEDIKHTRSFVKEFGLKLRIKNVLGGGEVDYIDGIIIINPLYNVGIRNFLSTVFHELWHCICYQRGLYSNYHHEYRLMTRKETDKVRRIGLKAERFVDKKAGEMMSAYFPDVPYQFGYTGNKGKAWYYRYFLDKNYPAKQRKKK